MNTLINSIVAGLCIAVASAAYAQPVLQFSSATYRVNEAAGILALSVQRQGDPNLPVSVDFATANGTALAGLKYTTVVGTLTFGANETHAAIEVPMLNNGLVDGTRVFHVILSNPNNAILGRPASTDVQIEDNDGGLRFQLASYPHPNCPPVLQDAGVVRIGVVRGDDGDRPVTVDVATSDLSAINAIDYTGVVTNLAFAPTEWVKYVSVPILSNSGSQMNKTFRLTLSNAIGGSLAGNNTATVTITRSRQAFGFESLTYTIAEDAGRVLVGVLRGTDAANSIATVDFATEDLTAIHGRDYAATRETLSFAPQEKLKRVAVRVLNDGVKQGSRAFRVSLSNPTGGAVLGPGTNATVTILDNDPGMGFEATKQSVWAGAGAVTVTVIRGNDGNLGTCTVAFATSDGTAEAGKQYQPIAGTLAFQEQETVKHLTIPILPSAAGQGTGSFRVLLSNPTGGMTLGTETIEVTVKKNYATVRPPCADQLAVRREWGVNVLTWMGGGHLQRADQVTGPWQTLATAQSPYNIDSPVRVTFYRIEPPRPAALYVPSSYDGSTPLPLLMMLHGGGITGLDAEAYWQFRPLAEARGFLYCYPDACGSSLFQGMRFWIDCDEADNIFAQFGDPHVDDAGYLRRLIQQIGREFAVDSKRVYLVGQSNGGTMVYTMACSSPDLIAGIASLNGPFYPEVHTRCAPAQPVNILSIAGTSDPSVRYWGGVPDVPSNIPIHTPHPSARRVAEIWAARNGAQTAVADAAATRDVTTDVQGLDTVVTQYTSHPLGGAVELWTILGGNHLPTPSSTFRSQVMEWFFAHAKP